MQNFWDKTSDQFIEYVTREGDTFENLSSRLDIPEEQLRNINQIPVELSKEMVIIGWA